MAIHPAVEYDRGLKRFIGLVTPELARNDSEAATQAQHALTIVVRGVTSHWKQPVSNALTPASLDSKKLYEYLLRVIKHLADVGIHVVCLTSIQDLATKLCGMTAVFTALDNSVLLLSLILFGKKKDCTSIQTVNIY